ncbi:MAG TPA: YwbE family protein [Candidatus Handelsmanbacteria bacterium]|nr:YwbE family protein [Candidatus Latescibacterota bacterium]HIG17351.1 YwbE family protein [Candidatus Handelsmanbacteria bacterium]
MGKPERTELLPGTAVAIVQKHHQRSGQLTEGVVRDLLTKSATHPHGIKVRLETGEVGRVQNTLTEGES